MFDFMLLRYENFTDWPQESENVIQETNDFFYRQKIDPGKAHIRVAFKSLARVAQRPKYSRL